MPDQPFVELVLWLDSSADHAPTDKLEHRVQIALDPAVGVLSPGSVAFRLAKVHIWSIRSPSSMMRSEAP